MQELTFEGSQYRRAHIKCTAEVPLGLTTATSAFGTVHAIDSENHALNLGAVGLPVELPQQIARVDRALIH